MKPSSSPRSRGVLRKLAFYGAIVLAAFYVLAVGAGYSWLRFARKNDQVSLLDVAFFRVTAIRRTIATTHFAKAQSEWDAKNFQAAYLYFSAGVRQDPDNVVGRVTAARFLRSVGANNLALNMLQEGLARSPEDRRIIEPTFELLLATGGDQRVLDLLKQRYGSDLSGSNGALLQRYEVEATLTAQGAPAAAAVLNKHPSLVQDMSASRIVARVYWETRERLRAIGILDQYLQAQGGALPDYALLASWQEASGQPSDAVRTARRAIEKFPKDTAARVMLVEMLLAETPGGTTASQAIVSFLKEFGNRPEAVQELATLAGKRGWVALNRTLYEYSANQLGDLNGLALSYSDSLARNSRFKESRQVLTELEAQAPDGGPAFMVQLRQRQVITSAALGDSDNVREYARRLAAVLSHEPEGLESCRKIFQKLGIVEAVAELTSRSAAVRTVAKK